MRAFVLSLVGALFGFVSITNAATFYSPQFAQIVSTTTLRPAVGSRISFILPGETLWRTGLFLGRVIKPNGSVGAYTFLDESRKTIFHVESEYISQSFAASFARASTSGFEDILDPALQQGGTCTGYAIHHFLSQMHLSGFRGNGSLSKTLSTEEGRTGLLVDAINQYYLVLQHRHSVVGILNQYGKSFGFGCQLKQFNSSAVALEFLKRQLATGSPVLISFNIGPNMRLAPFQLVTVGANDVRQDIRLWVPRKVGERNYGGHTIVAAATFEFQGRMELLVIDSDWDEPRVWDAEDYFDSRTAMDEIEFVSCS